MKCIHTLAENYAIYLCKYNNIPGTCGPHRIASTACELNSAGGSIAVSHLWHRMSCQQCCASGAVTRMCLLVCRWYDFLHDHIASDETRDERRGGRANQPAPHKHRRTHIFQTVSAYTRRMYEATATGRYIESEREEHKRRQLRAGTIRHTHTHWHGIPHTRTLQLQHILAVYNDGVHISTHVHDRCQLQKLVGLG